MDLTRYPELAKELKINMEGYAGEIPVFIAFRKVVVSVDLHYRGKRSVVSPSLVRSHEEGAVDGLRWGSVQMLIIRRFSVQHLACRMEKESFVFVFTT